MQKVIITCLVLIIGPGVGGGVGFFGHLDRFRKLENCRFGELGLDCV